MTLWLLIWFLYYQKKRKEEFSELLKEEIGKTALEREKFEMIINSISEGLYVLDKDGRFVYFNQAAEQLLGLTAEKVLGRMDCEIINCRDDQDNKLCYPGNCPLSLSWKESKTKFYPVLYFNRADGAVFPVSLMVSPVMGRSGPAIGVFLFRDITRELEIDRAKSSFISVASHQMRTPLNALRWILEMIINGELGKVNPKQKDFISDAYESTIGLTKLINDLLGVSRVDAGKFKLKKEPVDIKKLFDQVVFELSYLTRARNVTVENQINDCPPVVADSEWIKQVITNLTDNAIKYNRPKGNVLISNQIKGAQVVFTIADTGIGIPVDQQNKIFEKFYRAENAIALQTGGTGLGLYIVKPIIEAAGGKIWFKSALNQGTTFYFTLPLAKI